MTDTDIQKTASGHKPRIGVLLTNLGTPDAPTKKAVRKYLKQFLSDPRVVEAPRLLWWLILNLIILNTRPRRSAAAYAKVWTDQGSPLLSNTLDQQEALQAVLRQEFGDRVIVECAMRYGSPSIANGVQSLIEQGAERLLALPLYPQYSGPTTGSNFDALNADFSRRRWLPALRVVAHYHDHPAYIDALAGSIRRHWEQHGRAQKLVLSYHGAPQDYHEKGDPYFSQCQKSSLLLAEALGLNEDEYLISFQSRFGTQVWLQPYTDETLKALPAQGVKEVQILCPGFSSDCLETLEEIAMENREYFLAAGGTRYEYIHCLNSEPAHIDMMRQIVEDNIAGWL